MNLDTISEQITALSQQVALLHTSGADQTTPSVPEALAPLAEAVEELRVAEEELREQDAQLAESQETLEAARQHWHALFDLAPDGYLVTDPKGLILEANQAAASMFIMDPGELVGLPLVVFVPGERKQEFLARLLGLTRQGGRQEWEMDLLPHHAHPFPATVSVVLIRQEQAPHNERAELAWLIHDISEHRRLEHELRSARDELEVRVQERTAQLTEANTALQQAREAAAQNEQHFRLALAHSPVVVFNQDRALRYTWVYDPQQGFPVADMLGKTDSDLLSAEDAEQRTVIKRRALASGVAQRAEVRTTVNGEVFYHNLAVEPLRDLSGRVIGITGVRVDVTENHRTAERMRALSRRLLELQENERSYVADRLYNEAGQVLAALRLQLSVLERQAGSGTLDRERVAETQATLDRVMREMHYLASALRPAVLDRLGLVSALRQELAVFGEGHGVQAQFVSAGIEHMRVAAEVETAIYRIVQEGLRNVAQHAQATHVDLAISGSDGHLVVALEDDGVGFDPALAERDGALGLVGMRERAEAVGGHLTVESQPGVSTTIIAQVPVKPAE